VLLSNLGSNNIEKAQLFVYLKAHEAPNVFFPLESINQKTSILIFYTLLSKLLISLIQ